jgi:uncharacterized cupredoxin-like copper-binding protein
MRRLTLFVIAAAMVFSACGGGGMGGMDHGGSADADDAPATRTVDVAMVDIAFEPATIDVKEGETIRFVFTNTGQLPHDAFIGDTDAQAEHGTEMRQADDGPRHSGAGGSGNGITVEPGETLGLTYTFDDRAAVEIGCHQPGHYEAGMKVAVSVS